MDALEAMIGSLPDDSGRIRRLFWHDPVFRTVCEDHRDAITVLARLERADQPDFRRIEEYRRLRDELLAEADKLLKRNADRDGGA